MKVLELNLSDPTVTKLQEAAERLSVSPEELAILSLEEKLGQLEDQFGKASDYVVNKNAELYKRLA
jgi:antitoxin FitA